MTDVAHCEKKHDVGFLFVVFFTLCYETVVVCVIWRVGMGGFSFQIRLYLF